MKIKSENTAKKEMTVISLLLILKTLFTQPLYGNLIGAGPGGFGVSELTSAFGALILSVLFSIVLIKAAKKIGGNATLLVILAVAEPLFITTVSSLFHALAAIITVIWVAVSLYSDNKIAVAAVSVVSAAVISFVMPSAIFSYVVLGIIVLLASQWNGAKVIGIISAVISAAVSVIVVSAIDIETRMNLKLSGLFYNFGGNECNPLSITEISHAQRFDVVFANLGKAFIASLPVVAVVIFVAVALFGYEPDRTEKKKSAGAYKAEKILTVIALVVPYIFAAVSSVVCTGVSGIMGFNIVPIIVIFALAVKGNKGVVYALEKLNAFAQAHLVLAVISILWLASNTTAFVLDTGLFVHTTQFTM